MSRVETMTKARRDFLEKCATGECDGTATVGESRAMSWLYRNNLISWEFDASNRQRLLPTSTGRALLQPTEASHG